MMKVTLLVTMAMAGMSLAFPYQPPAPHASHSPQKPLMPYQFNYGVQDPYSGNNFGRSEASDGNVVQGTYSVNLPDGRVQTVNYSADKYSGFQADVSYSGPAHAPAHY